MRYLTVCLSFMLAACGGHDPGNDDVLGDVPCDAVGAAIEKAADDRGLPRQGVCSEAVIKDYPEFAGACERLRECGGGR